MVVSPMSRPAAMAGFLVLLAPPIKRGIHIQPLQPFFVQLGAVWEHPAAIGSLTTQKFCPALALVSILCQPFTLHGQDRRSLQISVVSSRVSKSQARTRKRSVRPGGSAWLVSRMLLGGTCGISRLLTTGMFLSKPWLTKAIPTQSMISKESGGGDANSCGTRQECLLLYPAGHHRRIARPTT